jgi:YHS domain-containing protein
MRGLLYLALLVLVMIVVPAIIRSWRARVPATPRTQRDELVKDPVCQTYVLLSRSVTTEEDGVVTHFCSRECAARFARGERHR